MNEPEELWYKDYDADTHKSLEAFKTPQDLAKSYIETKSMVGNSIRVPGKDAGEDDTKAFYDKIVEKAPNLMLKPDLDNKEQSDEFYNMAGRPTESGKYEAVAPEGFEVNGDRDKLLKDIAFEAGLSGKQFKGVMEKVYAEDFKAQQIAQDEYVKNSDALKIEWGSAYDEKINTAMDLSNKFFGEIFKKETIPADFARGLDKLSSQFSKEDLNSAKPEQKVVVTPAEASQAIAEIYANPKHPYFNQMDILNESAQKRMVELQRYANPEQK